MCSICRRAHYLCWQDKIDESLETNKGNNISKDHLANGAVECPYCCVGQKTGENTVKETISAHLQKHIVMCSCDECKLSAHHMVVESNKAIFKFT